MIAVLTDHDAIAAGEDDTDVDSGDDCDEDEDSENNDDNDDDDNAADNDDSDSGAWLVHSSRPTWRSCLRDGNPAGGWPEFLLLQIFNL